MMLGLIVADVTRGMRPRLEAERGGIQRLDWRVSREGFQKSVFSHQFAGWKSGLAPDLVTPLAVVSRYGVRVHSSA